jgi:hypothetical protein
MSKVLIENHQKELEKNLNSVKSELKLSETSCRFFDGVIVFIKDFYECYSTLENKISDQDRTFKVTVAIATLGTLIISFLIK